MQTRIASIALSPNSADFTIEMLRTEGFDVEVVEVSEGLAWITTDTNNELLFDRFAEIVELLGGELSPQ